MNPESVVVLAHGLRLVVSTLQEDEQAFQCSVFEGNVREEEPLAYRVISNGFEALTCLEAQPLHIIMPSECIRLLPIGGKNHGI